MYLFENYGAYYHFKLIILGSINNYYVCKLESIYKDLISGGCHLTLINKLYCGSDRLYTLHEDIIS